ncbi:dTDP-4-dehydrorhamnose reductase [Tsuneonella mangrovi]|uniref:dTDP-4-dehydrorhamnose reductase n=1 Tax=Tsuneonella mangrovi TaxID=1982042 RepID=UPI000BA2A255|nr:dTDP-4-dehydrorhamnose reductase [Tsuneonella mangrovi]
MKVLVTGGGGQLGRALVTAAPAGWDCVATDRARLDLGDPLAIYRVVTQESPDLVINAAAYTAVDRAECEAELAFAINAAAVGHLAEAASSIGAKFVQVSTDYVFDGEATCPYPPDAARNPLSVYGRSKAAGEDAAGRDALIVRTSWLYEAGGANFVRTMLRLMAERDEVRVVADQVGTPTRATEAARAIWQLAERGASGTWHYSDGGAASWHELAAATYKEARRLGLLDRAVAVEPIASADYPVAARRPAYSVLDCSETYALLGLAPPGWRANLRQMLMAELAGT